MMHSTGGWPGFGSWWRGRGEKGRDEEQQESGRRERGNEGTSAEREDKSCVGGGSRCEAREGLNEEEARSECYNEDEEERQGGGGGATCNAERDAATRDTATATGEMSQQVTTALAKWTGVGEMSLKEVLAITDNFAQARILHERRSVVVYRACCPASGQVWAVKRAKLSLLSPSPTSPGGSGSGPLTEGGEEGEGEEVGEREGAGQKAAHALAAAAAAGVGGAGGGGRGGGGGKALPAALAASPEAVVSMTAGAFAEAAMALGGLAHPRLARVVAFCRECAERILVLEMVQGEPLSLALHAAPPPLPPAAAAVTTGRAALTGAAAAALLSLPQRLQVAADVASALKALHAYLQVHEPPPRKERLYSHLLTPPPRAHGAVTAENVIVDAEGRGRLIGGAHLRSLLVQQVGRGACAVGGGGFWGSPRLEVGEAEEEEQEVPRQQQQQQAGEREEAVFETSSNRAAYVDTWQASPCLSPCVEALVPATAAGDVFSVGVLLLELVTGRRPVVRAHRDLQLAAAAAAAAGNGAGVTPAAAAPSPDARASAAAPAAATAGTGSRGRGEGASGNDAAVSGRTGLGGGGAGGARGAGGRCAPLQEAIEEGRESESEEESEEEESGEEESESEEEETASKQSLWSLPFDKSPIAIPLSPTHQPIPMPTHLPPPAPSSPSLRHSSPSSPPQHHRHTPLHIVTWVQSLLKGGDFRVIVDPRLGLWPEPEISSSGRVVCGETVELLQEMSGSKKCAGGSSSSKARQRTKPQEEQGAAGMAGAAAGLVGEAVEEAYVAAVIGVVDLALRCVLPAPPLRPSMAQVATALELLRLDLQGELEALGAAGGGAGDTAGMAQKLGQRVGLGGAGGGGCGRECGVSDEVTSELSFKERSPRVNGTVTTHDDEYAALPAAVMMPRLQLDEEEEDEGGEEEEEGAADDELNGNGSDSHECCDDRHSLSAATASATLAAVSETMSGGNSNGAGAALGEDEATSGKRRGWFSARADWEGEVTSGEIEEEEDGEEEVGKR
ncbi:hypothetical protein CLOM_g20109 [Closterium sp. NIES-68]|nr:hypothetical protein CLOM_g20109 [Closterium sp. NIES-68]